MLSAWKASQVAGDKHAKQPWIICGRDASASRAEQIESAGARIIRADVDTDGKHPAPSTLLTMLQAAFLPVTCLQYCIGSR